MNKLPGVLAIAGASLFSVSALAADISMVDPVADDYVGASRSWYVEGRVGSATAGNHGFDSTSTGPGQYKPDTGYNISLDVGKYISDNWRAEIGIYRNHGSNGSATLAAGTPIAHSGSVTTLSFMGNLLYAFNAGSNLRPYVGGGLGFTNFDFNGLGATGGGFTITGSDTVFTAALHLGLDYKVMDRVTLTSRYSLAWVDGGSYSTTTAGMNVTTSSETENIFGFGVRVDLN